MKCTFALIVDENIQNFARKKAVQINESIGNGFLGALLPSHISLKQPFKVESMSELAAIESYFDKFSSEISPFFASVGPTYIWENVIGLVVRETSELRDLHNKLNKELPSICKNPSALHDGESYRFHVSIAVSGQDKNMYLKAYDLVRDDKSLFETKLEKTALFYYDDDNYPVGSFITYKVNTLQKNFDIQA